MKNILYLSSLFFFISCNTCKQSSKAKSGDVSKITKVYVYDSTFEYHFHILDSVSNSNPLDSIYTCECPSIDFMENKTKIESATEGTFFGKSKFTKYNLFKWHQWYNSMKKNK
jgi:hypothetical protein